MIASGAKRNLRDNPGYYWALLEEFPEGFPSPYKNQIDLDLHRTFPDDPYFKSPSIIKKLQNVLLTFSRRNLTIGYCQGFNFIVGKLLKMIGDEEQVFWLFTMLIENILPLNYFTNMAGVMIDCAILNRLVKVYIQDLYQYLVAKSLQMHVNNIIYKWFVSSFISNTSEEVPS